MFCGIIATAQIAHITFTVSDNISFFKQLALALEKFLLKAILMNTQVVLLRCGQPLTAIGSKRSREDEKLINDTLGGDSKGFIIDTRSQAAAMNSRSKGTSEAIIRCKFM